MISGLKISFPDRKWRHTGCAELSVCESHCSYVKWCHTGNRSRSVWKCWPEVTLCRKYLTSGLKTPLLDRKWRHTGISYLTGNTQFPVRKSNSLTKRRWCFRTGNGQVLAEKCVFYTQGDSFTAPEFFKIGSNPQNFQIYTPLKKKYSIFVDRVCQLN